MDLMGMQIAENRRKLKMTVLHRPGDVWRRNEISQLTIGLMTEVSQHPKHPEHLILFGHHSESALKTIIRGATFTAIQIIGLQDERLPFNPGFV
ncbi:MAG: hypothetical protein WCK11_05375 [Candidatus Falkowbacteria bacterium]